jgi:hypothetical protein
MILNLNRNDCRADGIFGTLTCPSEGLVISTLEHAYIQPDGTYAPKIPRGTFTCQRSMHRLHGMTEDFETFEITGVAGHSNLLFHWGNYNKDSEGCVLLGSSRSGNLILNSRSTFAKFMAMQKGLKTFDLVVN